MKTSLTPILTLGLISMTALSSQLSESEFKERVNNIAKAQSVTDQLMQRIGANPFSKQDQEEHEKRSQSILQIHTDLRSTRIQNGKLLYGTLLNRLVVGPDGSPIIVRLDNDQGKLSGLRLLGQARQAGAAGRLAIEFSKLSTANGKAVCISATGLDEQGAYGVAAQVFSSKALMVAGAMAGSFIAGVAASQQSQSTNAFGFQQTPPTGRNAILQGVAQTAADQSKRLIEEATAEKPILVLEPNAKITAYILDEVKF